jgi:hypothetical protein
MLRKSTRWVRVRLREMDLDHCTHAYAYGEHMLCCVCSSSVAILSEIVRTNETCRLYSDACVALCKEMELKVVDLWHAMQKREDWMTACFT